MNKRLCGGTLERTQSLTDLAYAHLEELIVTLKLAPGAVVSESDLSELTGIGRTPIREALQRLAREKLVSILPRRGIVVTEINVGNQLRLLEVRRELERLIARSAARRATDAERQRFQDLARLFERSARANDDVTFMRTDREFNTLCSAAAHNEFAAGAIVAAQPYLSFPALAQARPLRIGIIAPKSGIAGTIGDCGLRGCLFAVERINAAGGIAGRKVELIVEEESNPKDSIERLRKLVLQDKVDCVQGVISTGVSLAMGAVAEEMKALTIFWDGTTQDGVKETMLDPRYVFRSTDNECEAVMGSLLAIKYWKGKFATVAGINPDYSYGRNNFAAFQALLKKFGVEHRIVADQWPKVGTLDLTSHVAALKAAKPDLVFSSLLFADLPIFMRTAHGAGLMDGNTKFAFPAAAFQDHLPQKDVKPE